MVLLQHFGNTREDHNGQGASGIAAAWGSTFSTVLASHHTDPVKSHYVCSSPYGHGNVEVDMTSVVDPLH